MKYSVTPFCLSQATLMTDPMASVAREEHHIVQPINGYDERPRIEANVEDAHAACEQAWGVYQNLDDDRQCPDGGRSLMVGDMARVECGGDVSWWICCSIGWTETFAPTNTRQVTRGLSPRTS